MVPKLRFKEFCGEWEETELKNKVDIIMGQSPSSDSYSEEKIGVPLVQGNADIKNRITFPTRYTNKPTKICKKDSLIMTVRAPVGYIGKANQEVCIGRGVCEIRVKKCNSEYIYQFLINKEYSWNKISQGSTFTSISSNDIKKLKIYIPSLSEQTKIADFLSTVDDKIQNQQDKITHLENIKKGFIQKIFSRKIRFKDDGGETFPEWEERKLGDFLIKYDEITVKNNQYPPLTSSRKGIFLQKDYFNNRQIASEDNTGYNIVPFGYFTYRHMSDDAVFYFNINNLVEYGIVSTLYPVFTTTKKMNSIFLQYYLNESNTFKKYCILQKQGGSRTYMYFNKLKQFIMKIPCLKEQQKIADFLSSFDKKISTEKETLEHLKQLKKGLLQQMFV